MRPPQHSVVPEHISSRSISDRELVLPEDLALEALDIAEGNGILVLGWEGWVKAVDGRVGHGSAPRGTVSLEGLTVAAAAQLCRETIPEAAEEWRRENPETTDRLHFCLTFRLPEAGRRCEQPGRSFTGVWGHR